MRVCHALVVIRYKDVLSDVYLSKSSQFKRYPQYNMLSNICNAKAWVIPNNPEEVLITSIISNICYLK